MPILSKECRRMNINTLRVLRVIALLPNLAMAGQQKSSTV